MDRWLRSLEHLLLFSGLDSKNSHSGSQTSVTPVLEDSMLPSELDVYQTCGAYAYRQNIYPTGNKSKNYVLCVNVYICM